MNYLFHLYLSGDDAEIVAGNFMGDFVKGPLGGPFPPRLRSGIELHRRIDSFAQREPQFMQSRLRIDPRFGLYRGVLVDLFYDHFLALNWEEWSPEPLTKYLQRVRHLVEEQREFLPERLKPLVPVIFEQLIPSYLQVEGVGSALTRMSRRLRRVNPLAGGGEELARHYAGLRKDFLAFRPAACKYAADFLEGFR